MSQEVQTLQGQNLTANPFGGTSPAPAASGGNAMMTAESQRAIAEIQAMSIMAMHNPRNMQVAVDRILNECQRPSLAEVAIYSFPRGGQNVTGPSIRLAEVIKRHIMHIRSGWRCLERARGRSVIQAYAYDIQNNVGEDRTFEVRHWRDKKGGGVPITDERDIYELEANQAARRVRACILALVDGDVIEAALDQCTRTLEAKADTSAEGIKRMLEAFKPFKVNQAMVEFRIGRNITAITAAQMVNLKGILNGMKDGMSKADNWFDMSLADASTDQADDSKNSPSDANASLKDKIQKAKKEGEAEDQTKPEDAEKIAEELKMAMVKAPSVEEIDDIWNVNVTILQELKVKNKNAYDDMDKAYLHKREQLEKAEAKQKDNTKPSDAKADKLI